MSLIVGERVRVFDVWDDYQRRYVAITGTFQGYTPKGWKRVFSDQWPNLHGWHTRARKNGVVPLPQ